MPTKKISYFVRLPSHPHVHCTCHDKNSLHENRNAIVKSFCSSTLHSMQDVSFLLAHISRCIQESLLLNTYVLKVPHSQFLFLCTQIKSIELCFVRMNYLNFMLTITNKHTRSKLLTKVKHVILCCVSMRIYICF